MKLEKIGNLSEWFYLDSEWKDILRRTVKIVDGDRYWYI